MSDVNHYIAEMMRVSARAYAAHATGLLLERHPASGERFGASAFEDWQAYLAQRLTELAVAIELDEPALFRSQIEWTRDAFAARQLPVEDIGHGLEALREALFEELPDGMKEVPGQCIGQAIDALAKGASPPARLSADSEPSRIALRYIEAAVSGDQRGAAGIVLDAVDNGLSLLDAFESVLLPAEFEIGLMWHLGEIGVAEEHVATETTRTVMSVLAWDGPGVAADSPTVFVAAVEGDRHDIGVRATAGLIESRGVRAVSLGGDLPMNELVRAVVDARPDVVILSVALAIHLGQLRRTLGALRELGLDPAPLIWIGGPALASAPDLAEKLGADGFVGSPREALARVQHMVSDADTGR